MTMKERSLCLVRRLFWYDMVSSHNYDPLSKETKTGKGSATVSIILQHFCGYFRRSCGWTQCRLQIQPFGSALSPLIRAEGTATLYRPAKRIEFPDQSFCGPRDVLKIPLIYRRFLKPVSEPLCAPKCSLQMSD